MPNIELGVFLAFLIIPFTMFIFLPALKRLGTFGYVIFIGMGIAGFVMLGATALVFFSQYDVVLSEVIPATIQTATATEIERDSGGSILTNTTKSSEVNNPGYTIETPIINSFHNEFGYLVSGLMFLFGVLYFKILTMG